MGNVSTPHFTMTWRVGGSRQHSICTRYATPDYVVSRTAQGTTVRFRGEELVYRVDGPRRILRPLGEEPVVPRAEAASRIGVAVHWSRAPSAVAGKPARRASWCTDHQGVVVRAFLDVIRCPGLSNTAWIEDQARLLATLPKPVEVGRDDAVARTDFNLLSGSAWHRTTTELLAIQNEIADRQLLDAVLRFRRVAA